MRYFELLGFQHVILFVFPALIFMILLFVGLSRSHFMRKNTEERKRKIVHNYPANLKSRNSPFPLILFLIIVGFLIWTISYTLLTGILGVKI
jgi:Na+/H+ antiporter NhaC